MQLQHKKISTNKQRLNCSICNYRIDPNDQSAFVTFPCSIRAFKDEKFKVWRCPDCQTIHCLDVVDLNHYYAKYAIFQTELTWTYRFAYSNLYLQLKKHGFSKSGSLLDYGCGANALFVQYLQEQGFANTHGYDPYGTKDGFGNPTTLQRGPFDYILLQDVIEHVEDPNALLSELDSLLAPGGYILIGTPNAANIDLNQPDLPEYYNCVHIPYHLHIYTREILESLGKSQGWEPVDFFARKYYDTPWFGFNYRALNAYVSLLDGTINVLCEPFKLEKALTSPKFLFYAIFGYWLSFHVEMSIMFRKSL